MSSAPTHRTTATSCRWARVAGHAGYMSNYFRWFGSPEDPFGWLLQPAGAHDRRQRREHLDPVTRSGMRKSLCWLLLSRESAAATGTRGRREQACGVGRRALCYLRRGCRSTTACGPRDRSPPGALITYVLIERAIMSGRMTPAALAVLTAAFTLGIQPTGLIRGGCAACRRTPTSANPGEAAPDRRQPGRWSPPLLAAGTVILTVVFADQTLATVMGGHQNSHGHRSEPGVVHGEFALLLPVFPLPTVDGSLSRRFRFLLHCALTVHRHVSSCCGRKRVPGIARGTGMAVDGRHLRHHVLPDVSRQRSGCTTSAFSPRLARQWAAVTTVLVSPAGDGGGHETGWRSLAAVFFMLALCFATTNGWWLRVELRSAVQQTRRRRSLGSPSVSSSSSCSRSPRSMRPWLHFVSRDHGEGRIARRAHGPRRSRWLPGSWCWCS